MQTNTVSSGSLSPATFGTTSGGRTTFGGRTNLFFHGRQDADKHRQLWRLVTCNFWREHQVLGAHRELLVCENQNLVLEEEEHTHLRQCLYFRTSTASTFVLVSIAWFARLERIESSTESRSFALSIHI
jgi:hypothetical protein